ncbi:MAG: glycoside hydrolase family 92 protein, partial [Muribaculaceae bacterium]|nr:glycoside hydrolase family 92 protein [Muribaculaceae bacterium]
MVVRRIEVIFVCLLVGVFYGFGIFSAFGEELWRYVDPKIGSEGLGRVFIGPSSPFGMVKPSPDCTVSPNSGWLPMPIQVNGFAQVHVSGTGGGPKYGNILLLPFVGSLSSLDHIAHRKFEEISLGYYATEFEENGIKTEITTAPRASFYRLTYPTPSKRSLMVDAGFFLGENPVPDAREAQQFVGSEAAIVSDREIAGYTRIRGGWNNGRAYTVYFHLISDTPFAKTATWKGDSITLDNAQFDSGKKTGALVQFDSGESPVNLTVGISFLSERKAV